MTERPHHWGKSNLQLGRESLTPNYNLNSRLGPSSATGSWGSGRNPGIKSMACVMQEVDRNDHNDLYWVTNESKNKSSEYTKRICLTIKSKHCDPSLKHFLGAGHYACSVGLK